VNCYTVDYNVRRTRPEIVSSYTLPKTVWGLVGDTVKLQCLFSGRSDNRTEYGILSVVL